ncbi:MAG: NADH-quinone oxidoreductase subunit NuoE [Theionarchaea archaeon]|nr:NADH-quinone oxidoreductase subunit NuoE [Theionarchaea archaeon]MBU7037937.1 NADH-quinone oxidoreductase subunit NuoE [Theionarchaea archaeon]MBU7041544.1 NADH-quinone oxidoreductase subunit NuoE [Theionarchaea archaeon]
MKDTTAVVKSVLDRWNNDSACLISILLDIQEELNYLPHETITAIADSLGIPLIDVYSAATFYTVFSLEPRGKHIVNVCVGTACHVRGGKRILDRIQRDLKLNPGETTEDGLFTLETVRCLGCCALGPVMVVDETYYPHMTTKKADTILSKYRKDSEGVVA